MGPRSLSLGCLMVFGPPRFGLCITVFARGVVGDSQRLPSVTRLGRTGAESDVS